MAGKLNATLILRNPETMVAEALVKGSDLPDWAADLVHPDNIDSGSKSDDKSGGYGGMKVAELEAEVEKRNEDREDDTAITVDGSGKDGKVTKADLIAALEADDKSADDA